MRFFVVSNLVRSLSVAIVFIALACGAALGQTTGNGPSIELDESKIESAESELPDALTSDTLNNLFDELRKQTNSKAAKRISKKIWKEWSDSGSPSIDLLMVRSAEAMRNKHNNVALDLLDQVVTLAPEYAEGWNRRATLYYGLRKFGRSIVDIERVLHLEPRHYGALSGLAVMLEALGKDKKSLETWYKVLEIYPANSEAQSRVIKLEDKLSGSPT